MKKPDDGGAFLAFRAGAGRAAREALNKSILDFSVPAYPCAAGSAE
jgi:hypothetical protein